MNLNVNLPLHRAVSSSELASVSMEAAVSNASLLHERPLTIALPLWQTDVKMYTVHSVNHLKS